MKLGFLYAGQGSQHEGMGADLYEKYPVFKEVIDSVNLDFDIKKLSFEDRDGLINQTRYTQPCMVAFAVGVTKILEQKGIVPEVVAGLSLGEYSALYAAGVFDAKTAINMVAFRGRQMEQAARGKDCSMVAVIGLDRDKVKEACENAADEGCVVISNYNCKGQIVVGGEKAAVKKAAALAKEMGAKRCLPLNVSGPFHTPLMKEAGDALREYFKDIEFAEPKIPVIFNCIADVEPLAENIPELLVRQVQSSVYMEDSIVKMQKMGVDAIVEIGPGKVLSGFVKKSSDIPVCSVETAEDIEGLADTLKKLTEENQ